MTCKLNKPYTAKEIAKKYKLSLLKSRLILDEGQKVELEHTSDKATAQTIASQHIYKESKDYYKA
ncbi:MAG: hypothetical protein WCI04_06320, partial [archaeon]